MADFNDTLSPPNLDDRQVAEIAFILSSPAYEHSFKPYIMAVLRQLERLWRDPSAARKDKYPDDFVRGGIAMGEGFLSYFDLLVKETSAENIMQAMSNMTNDDLYEMHRRAGRVKPVVGIDQPALPQAPSPDEDY